MNDRQRGQWSRWLGSGVSTCAAIVAFTFATDVVGAALPAAPSAAPSATSCSALRDGDHSSASALEIDASADAQLVNCGAMLLEDVGGAMNLDAVRAAPAARWVRPAAGPLALGYTRSVWWVRLRLAAPAQGMVASSDRVLALESPLEDGIEPHVVSADGHVVDWSTMGDLQPPERRPMAGPVPAIPLTFAAGQTLEVYLRLTSQDGVQETLPLRLWREEAWRVANEQHWIVSGLYYGVFGTFIFYSIVLYVVTGTATPAWYGTYLASIMAWRALFSGDAQPLLWRHLPGAANMAILIAIAVAFACAEMFVSNYLDLRRHFPRMAKALRGLVLLWLCVAATTLLGHFSAPLGFVLAAALAWSVCEIYCAVVLLVRLRSVRAAWVLVAWLPLFLGVVLYILQMPQWRWVPQMGGSGRLIEWSALAQALTLGFGVADATYRWYMTKLEADRSLIASKEALTVRLDAEVQQRTLELEGANARLEMLSITDGLTGVPNRRHFDKVLAGELARWQPLGRRPALCLLDVDHFKAYNDIYGHQRGDTALRSIAEALRRSITPDEGQLFRVGGEEFAFVLQPDDAGAQWQKMEVARLAVERLGLHHEASPYRIVTASFGLVQTRAAGDLPGAPVPMAALYREADRLLYAAKGAGRNCIACDAKAPAEWPESDFAKLGMDSAPVM